MAQNATHLMIKGLEDFSQSSFAVPLFFFKSPCFSFLFIKTGNSYHSLSVRKVIKMAR